MTLLRRFALALVLSSICCCATAPMRTADDGLRVLASVLADACTSEATDEVLIDHAAALLASCHYGASACVRKVCVRLEDEGDAASARNRIGLASCSGIVVMDSPLVITGPPIPQKWTIESIPAVLP